MDFQLKDARPIWLQLADQITESIVTGEYLPGERFPAVRELAMQADMAMEAGVNPNTMQRALARLEELGLLVTARTAGRSVTEDSRVLQDTRRMLAEEKAAEYMDGMKKLGFSHEEAAAYAAKFGKEEKE